jgi:hypothetical protein
VAAGLLHTPDGIDSATKATADGCCRCTADSSVVSL